MDSVAPTALSQQSICRLMYCQIFLNCPRFFRKKMLTWSSNSRSPLTCFSHNFFHKVINHYWLHSRKKLSIVWLPLLGPSDNGRTIRDAGDAQPPGSFLAWLHDDLDDPAGFGAFNITHVEERERKGRGQVEQTREVLWSWFRTHVHLFWMAVK